MSVCSLINLPAAHQPTCRGIVCSLLAMLAIGTAIGKETSAEEARHYRIVTGPAGTQAYAIGVGVTSLVKLNIMPRTGVDLNPVATSGLLESFDLLSRGEAEFALLSAVWSDLVAADGGAQPGGAFGQVQSVATLWREGDRSTQLVARRDVDDAVVYDIVKTIFENLYFLENVDDSMAEASLDGATDGMSLPLHAGARRYFQENEALADTGHAETATALPAVASDGDAGRAATSGKRKTFVVYFDFDEATIKPEGDAVLDGLEALGDELKTSTVWIAGYTDTTGQPDYNLQLGQRRVDAVIANLRARGIDSREVYAAAFGERAPWIKTPDEANEARNRRVEIYVDFHQTEPVPPESAEPVVAERENPDLVATDDPVPVESKDADLIATDDPVLVDGKVEPASAPRTGATIGVGSRQPTF